MQKIFNKIICFLFVGFISVTFVLTFLLNFNGMKSSLYENKNEIMDVKLSSDYFKNTIEYINSAINDNTLLHDEYIDLYGGIQLCLGKDIIWDMSPNNTIVKGSDGKLYSVNNITANSTESVGYNDIDDLSIKLKNLCSALEKENVPITFFQAPSRVDLSEITLPITTYDDNSINRINYFEEILANVSNLSVINFQRIYKERGIKYQDLFFKTDHHWKIETAFYAYKELCASFNLNYGTNIPQQYFDEESFEFKILKNTFMGSLGVRTGSLFTCGKDDFCVILPKFDTQYEKIISKNEKLLIKNGGEKVSYGSYDDVIYTGGSNPIYGDYVCTDRSEVILRNSKAPINKKVLIIKDSFALPVSAFLSTVFSEVRMIDLRSEHENVVNYTKENNMDLVLILYSAGAYTDTFFDFD